MSGGAVDDLADLIRNAPNGAADFVILRALAEDASEAGARKALALLGLEDDHARRDMDQLRELLGTWRDVKRSAWQSVARFVTRVLLATLLVGLAYRLDLFKLLDS